MGGNGVEAVKESSSRWRRRVKCAAASREKIKTGWGVAPWVDRFRDKVSPFFSFKIAPPFVC
jgi:hypothetical protein